MFKALITVGVFAVLGLLGAAAFNPEGGLLWSSEPLWRTFGIAAYIGWLALPLVSLAALIHLAFRRARRDRNV